MEQIHEMTQYAGDNKMRELISHDPSLLMALTRFGISLGFGDKTVEEVCKENNLHCGTFLAVANFISGHAWFQNAVSAAPLVEYLKNAHAYFLNFMLPMIRRKLIEVIDCSRTEGLGFLILKFYDDYVAEVAAHMEQENIKVFPYVDGLLQGRLIEGFSIGKFASHHTHIDSKLKELKDIIVRYYPERGNDLLNTVLFDIITCEHDLKVHCMIEDRLFVPVVKSLEEDVAQHLLQKNDADEQKENLIPETDAGKMAALSDREKEIICLIAKGLANKEIADKLCISIHTVTTHRRNISAKLQIHSPAGLTIFAIVNGLIPLEEIPRPR